MNKEHKIVVIEYLPTYVEYTLEDLLKHKDFHLTVKYCHNKESHSYKFYPLDVGDQFILGTFKNGKDDYYYLMDDIFIIEFSGNYIPPTLVEFVLQNKEKIVYCKDCEGVY